MPFIEPHVETALIWFCMKFDVKTPWMIFDMMVMKNEVSWKEIITDYVKAWKFM